VTWKERFQSYGLPALAIVGLFLLWEGIVVLFKIPSFVLPAPSVVVKALWRWRSAIWEHSVQTLMTTLIGFGVATGFGLILGWLIGLSPILYKMIYPILVGFNSIPKVAIVPVLVIWFGIGTVPAILTAFLISFFPIVVNVATGMATVEPELQDVLRSLGAGRLQMFLKIGLPRTLPFFFASLKVAITLAFVGAVISETVASNRGVGYLMIAASARFDVPLVFAGLLVIAGLGIILYVIFSALERKLTSWAYRQYI